MIAAPEPWQAVVYYLHTGPADPQREAQLSALLDDEARARAARLRVSEHRWTYVMAHALLQSCLTAAGAPSPLRFSHGPHGRPELAQPFGQPSLRFNLTHTEGLVAAAIGWGGDIGIDAERIEPSTPIDQLADRFFAADEAAFIAEADGEDALSRFFAIWTAKEAVVKALGLGLRLPLNSFSVGLDPLSLTFHERPPRFVGGWRLAALDQPRHRLTLAVRRARDESGDLDICFREVSRTALFQT